MNSLLGKALEQILVSMATTVQDFANYKQDFQKLQFQLQKQDGWLHQISDHLPFLLSHRVFLSSNVKDLTLVESASAEGKE